MIFFMVVRLHVLSSLWFSNNMPSGRSYPRTRHMCNGISVRKPGWVLDSGLTVELGDPGTASITGLLRNDQGVE